MPVSATITLWLFYHHLIQQELELRLTGYLFPVVACQRYQQGWYHLWFDLVVAAEGICCKVNGISTSWFAFLNCFGLHKINAPVASRIELNTLDNSAGVTENRYGDDAYETKDTQTCTFAFH